MMGGSVVPDGSVTVCGSVSVVDPRIGVVGTGEAGSDSSGSTGTGGPIFAAGAVDSAAAGKPGVCACTAENPQPSAQRPTSGGRTTVKLSSANLCVSCATLHQADHTANASENLKVHLAHHPAKGLASPACPAKRGVS